MTTYESISRPASAGSRHLRITQDALMVEATARFGPDPLDIAFVCPSCGDVATLREWKDLHGDTDPAGQQCVGRVPAYARLAAGMPATRGCGYAAYGLIGGPWEIILDSGKSAWGFALAGDPTPGGPVEQATA